MYYDRITLSVSQAVMRIGGPQTSPFLERCILGNEQAATISPRTFVHAPPSLVAPTLTPNTSDRRKRRVCQFFEKCRPTLTIRQARWYCHLHPPETTAGGRLGIKLAAKNSLSGVNDKPIETQYSGAKYENKQCITINDSPPILACGRP